VKLTEGRRIILTGPSGVEKKIVFESLKNEFLSKEGIPARGTEHFIQRFSIEDEIKDVMKADHISIFLAEKKRPIQRDIYKRAFNQLIQKIKDVSSETHIFVEIHTCYYYRQKRFSFWTFPEIEALSPSGFITLLNDSYTIWHLVGKREKLPVGSYLRLQDIIEWRKAEVLLTDCISSSLGVKNYIVPVKHPPQMLYRLLFEDEKNLLIYAAHPITAPRKSSEGRKEIDEHRYFLHSQDYIVFEPLPIDERAIQFAYEEIYGSVINPPKSPEEEIKLESHHRWPLVSTEFPPMVPDPPGIFPLSIPAEEAYLIVSQPRIGSKRMRSSIDSQIEERDFRYINDVDLVTAYRSNWKGIESRGVKTEVKYAGGLKPVIAYHLPQEDKLPPGETSPFNNEEHVAVMVTKQEFYNGIAEHLKNKIKKGGKTIWRRKR
jgi:hypothetical protein